MRFLSEGSVLRGNWRKEMKLWVMESQESRTFQEESGNRVEAESCLRPLQLKAPDQLAIPVLSVCTPSSGLKYPTIHSHVHSTMISLPLQARHYAKQ